jgi:hypothetical protein
VTRPTSCWAAWWDWKVVISPSVRMRSARRVPAARTIQWSRFATGELKENRGQQDDLCWTLTVGQLEGVFQGTVASLNLGVGGVSKW